jgi:nicotinamidase-related amidase
MKRLLLGVLGLLLLAGAALGITIWTVVHPTTGKPIAPGRAGKALLVIDLQEDYTGPHAQQHYPNPDKLLAANNQLIAAAQAGGHLVALVRVAFPDDWLHGMLSGHTAVAGTKGAEFDARLTRPPGFLEIVKTRSDSFTVPALDAQLDAHHVGELYIGGIDAGYCVKQTVAGARNRGYVVNVVREAISTSHSTPLDELIRGYERKGARMVSLEQAKVALAAGERP